MASSGEAFQDEAGATVWTLKDLRILHEIQKPIAVIVAGVYEDPHSMGGLQDFSKVVFQNMSCKKKFGLPRPQAEFSQIMKSSTETDRQKRRSWLMKMTAGSAIHQSWMNISDLLRPLFQGITDHSPNFVCRIDSKAIKVETAPGHVETAILHIAELDTSCTDLRVGAIHRRNPLHTFMFNADGNLLNANASALEAFEHHHTGGEEEGQAAYDEAMNAVFTLQLECHRHTQPHRSKKDGTTKWAMIEMWPMLDPVDASPAVLVKRYNITEQKHLELQLTAHQDALQRQNQELEQDSVALHEQHLRLQQEAEGLAERLEVVLHDKFGHRHSGFDSDTPIDKTLNFLEGIIEGTMPKVQMALQLYNILSESDTNLRQPVRLESQLLQDQRMDFEVGKSMLQLLQGNVTSATDQTSQVRAPPPPQASALPSDMPQPVYGPVAQPLEQQSSANKTELAVAPVLSTQVERFLQDAENNWQFDIFAFADATPGTTLSLLSFHFYKVTGIIQHFQLDAGRLFNFLQKIESGYEMSNPYHNSIHVASVVQMTHMLLAHGGIMQSGALNKVHQMSAYWSATVHDYEHGGLNNDFLIKTAHPLAITYNDISPLENHHLAASVRVIHTPGCGYIPISFLRSEDLPVLRSTCVNMVLGTDMKKHFDIMSRFQAAFKRSPTCNSVDGPSGVLKCQVEDWDAVKAEDKTLVHQMVVKCADIGHLAAGLNIHKRWAYQLEEEFFRQGDKEKAVGLGVSPLMDRSLQGGMTRSQLGFFNIVGTPMFKALVDLFPDAQPILDGVQANYAQWEQAAALATKSPT